MIESRLEAANYTCGKCGEKFSEIEAKCGKHRCKVIAAEEVRCDDLYRRVEYFHLGWWRMLAYGCVIVASVLLAANQAFELARNLGYRP